MIITCNQCSKKFKIDSKLIPYNGRLVQCSSCNNKWFFNPNKDKDIEDSYIKENTEINDIINPSEEIFLEDNEKLDDLRENRQVEIIKPKNDKKINEKKRIEVSSKKLEKSNKGILSYILLFLILFIGIIIVLDTFKHQLNNIIPGIDKILNSLYETLKDIYFFFKDLI